MKTREQMILEAKLRQEQIKQKEQKRRTQSSANVQTSWNRVTKEYMIGVGFYDKNRVASPIKGTPLAEKKLKKDVVHIDVRKNGKTIKRLVKKSE